MLRSHYLAQEFNITKRLTDTENNKNHSKSWGEKFEISFFFYSYSNSSGHFLNFSEKLGVQYT